MADSADFKKAAENVRNLAKTPSNDEFANMYSLFKQATSGDCDRSKPGVTDPLGRAKFEAWSSKQGMTKDEAAAKYIAAAKEAMTKYGLK